MRYRLSAFVATAAALLTSAAVVTAPPAAAAANLINNGGFETGTLSGWSCSSLDSVVTSPVHSGSHALSGAASSSDDAQCSQSVTVQPSSNYTLTGFVEGDYVFLGDSGTGTSDTDAWTPSATSWQELSTSFSTGASTTSVTIYVHGWYAQGTYFADDLSLTGPGGGGSPPGAPTGLKVTGTTSSSVSLSWTAPSGTVTGYNIYENGTRAATATGTSTTITGLAASTTYTFTVSATNSAGEGPQSTSVQGTTSSGGGGSPPGAPTGLKVTGTTSSSVSLSWTAPSGTVTGYNIYENGTRAATATGTSTTITGLAASTTYTFTVSATNSAGEGPQSTSVQGTTSSTGGGGGLPAHVLMGYWQDFTNGAMPLTLAQVPTSYNLIAVAFGSATGTPGQVAFSLDSTLSSDLGGYTQQQFINDIKTLNARGQKVILSIGGADGTISVSDSASANEFASSVNSLIQQYGFNGVDIDLENGVSPTFMAQALDQLSSDDPGLIITLAPQTVDMQSTGGDYFQLALDIKSILTMVNVQFYNSGTMNGCDGNVYAEATENFMTALACIELEGGLSPSQVGLGLPASPSAAGSGYTSPSVVNSALDCLAAGTSCGSFKPPTTYPSIRGAMTWSINWDASNGYNFADTVAPHLSTLP